jgi:hypothetical protein
LHQAAQVVQISRQAIHAAHNNNVALASEGKERLELRPLGILAGGFVGKDLIERNILQLPFGILIETAHPDITNALTWHLTLYKGKPSEF